MTAPKSTSLLSRTRPTTNASVAVRPIHPDAPRVFARARWLRCLPARRHRVFDGHPGYLHGGIIVTLLDEAMSKAVRAIGPLRMTRKMEVEYLRPVPSGARYSHRRPRRPQRAAQALGRSLA